MRLATCVLMLWMLPGCGSATSDGADAGADLSVPADGRSCVRDLDCGSAAFLCAYKIADGCAAAGHCARVATPTCAHVHYACGCDGSLVPDSDCFYASGYAGGPVSGDPPSSCHDGGI